MAVRRPGRPRSGRGAQRDQRPDRSPPCQIPAHSPMRSSILPRSSVRAGTSPAPRISSTSVYRYSEHIRIQPVDAVPVFDPHVCGLGELALARGDLSAARSHSAECLELATRTASRKNLVKGWRLAGEIAHAEGDKDAAEELFAQVARLRHVDWESGSAVEIGDRARPVPRTTSSVPMKRSMRSLVPLRDAARSRRDSSRAAQGRHSTGIPISGCCKISSRECEL